MLAGWNADEGKMMVLSAPQKPTVKSFAAETKKRFGDHYEESVKLFPGRTDEQALRSAEELASADFITYSTWKWLNLQVQTGQAPVYGYQFGAGPAVKPEPCSVASRPMKLALSTLMKSNMYSSR